MTEQSADFSQFDSQEAGRVLGAEPRTMRDLAHGDGEALSVGNTELEVYPSASFARVTTRSARVELFGVPTYTVDADAGRVVFEQGEQDDRMRLHVRADGKVSFHPVLRATQRPPTAAPAPTDQSAASPPSSRPDGTTTGVQPTGASNEDAAEAASISLTGRPGKDPRPGTEGDEAVMRFPLALAEQRPGQRLWHEVVVFGEPGVQQTTGIEKGDLVRVAGQYVRHDTPLPGQKPLEFYTPGVELLEKKRRVSSRRRK